MLKRFAAVLIAAVLIIGAMVARPMLASGDSPADRMRGVCRDLDYPAAITLSGGKYDGTVLECDDQKGS